MNNPSQTTPIPLSSVLSAGSTIETPHGDDSLHPRLLELDGISDAHKQRRITLFTTISVVIVFIKLCAITGVPVFASAMMGLLFGWTMVQSLLLLFHWRDMSEDEVSRAIHLYGRIRVSLRTNNVPLRICFVALHLPLFGYPVWFFAFKSSIASDPIVLFHYARLCNLLAMFSGLYFVVFTLSLAYVLSYACRWDYGWVPIIWILIGIPIFAWLFIASALEGGLLTESISSLMDAIFVYPFRFIIRSFVFISISISIVAYFWILVYHTPHGPSGAGFFLTAILFLIYLIRYDSSGTYKLNWMDWLG
jgi:hypothetical protein